MPAPQIMLSVVSHRQNDHRIGDVPAFRSAVLKGAMRWSDIGSWSALWETDDAVLVRLARSRAGGKGRGNPLLDRHKRGEHVSHSRVYRPWGYYESVATPRTSPPTFPSASSTGWRTPARRRST